MEKFGFLVKEFPIDILASAPSLDFPPLTLCECSLFAPIKDQVLPLGFKLITSCLIKTLFWLPPLPSASLFSPFYILFHQRTRCSSISYKKKEKKNFHDFTSPTDIVWLLYFLAKFIEQNCLWLMSLVLHLNISLLPSLVKCSNGLYSINTVVTFPLFILNSWGYSTQLILFPFSWAFETLA